MGKTRLSRAFKSLVESDNEENDEVVKFLYYNAFTEDLFSWENYPNRRLLIHDNGFTDWILAEEGQERKIISNFQHYTNDKLTPYFENNYREVHFSIEAGNEEGIKDIKISRGEESCFIWCIFYSFITQIIEILNFLEKEERPTQQFNELEYIFIDDPVSSLDENHLIELAVNIADLIKSSTSDLKFIITTHNPLFYNLIYNELNSKECHMLMKNEDGTFEFDSKKGDSNKSFSYHLFLKQTIEEAIETDSIQKYHFTLLRNLYEKTANFLGYPKWSDLLPDNKQTYYNRIIQFTSHSTLTNEAVAEPTAAEKQTVKFLLDHLIENRYWKELKQQ